MHIVAFFQTLSKWPKNETPDTHVTKMTPNVTVKNLIGTENYVHNFSPYFLKAQNETPKTKLQKKTYILTIPTSADTRRSAWLHNIIAAVTVVCTNGGGFLQARSLFLV